MSILVKLPVKILIAIVGITVIIILIIRNIITS